jgi:hypothetical protein
LRKLDISANELFAAGTKLLAEALEGNQIITELDMSGNSATWDGQKFGEVSGVAALTNVIPGMRAISTFTFSGDDEDSEPVTMETSMVEADFSRKGVGVSGAIMVAAFLPK